MFSVCLIFLHSRTSCTVGVRELLVFSITLLDPSHFPLLTFTTKPTHCERNETLNQLSSTTLLNTSFSFHAHTRALLLMIFRFSFFSTKTALSSDNHLLATWVCPMWELPPVAFAPLSTWTANEQLKIETCRNGALNISSSKTFDISQSSCVYMQITYLWKIDCAFVRKLSSLHQIFLVCM